VGRDRANGRNWNGGNYGGQLRTFKRRGQALRATRRGHDDARAILASDPLSGGPAGMVNDRQWR